MGSHEIGLPEGTVSSSSISQLACAIRAGVRASFSNLYGRIAREDWRKRLGKVRVSDASAKEGPRFRTGKCSCVWREMNVGKPRLADIVAGVPIRDSSCIMHFPNQLTCNLLANVFAGSLNTSESIFGLSMGSRRVSRMNETDGGFLPRNWP